MYYFAHEGHDHTETATYTARHTSSNYTLPIIIGVFTAVVIVALICLIAKNRSTKARAKSDIVK